MPNKKMLRSKLIKEERYLDSLDLACAWKGKFKLFLP